MKRFALRTFAVTALMTLMLGAVPAAAKERIRMAYFFDPTWEVLFYALRQGKVRSDLIDVSLESMDITALIQASGTKQYDVIEGSVIGVPQARSRGLEQVIIGTAFKPKGGRYIVVRADSPIKSPADLKGRSLAVPSLLSTAGTILRMSLMKKVGLNVALQGGDITWMEVPVTNMPALLERGRLDAAWVHHTVAHKVTAGAGYRIIYDDSAAFREVYGGYPIVSALVTYPEKVREKPDALREFLRVLRASIEYSRANADEVAQAVGQQYKVEPDFLKMHWREWGEYPVTLEETDLKVIERIWDLAKQMGVLRGYPRVDEVVWR